VKEGFLKSLVLNLELFFFINNYYILLNLFREKNKKNKQNLILGGVIKTLVIFSCLQLSILIIIFSIQKNSKNADELGSLKKANISI